MKREPKPNAEIRTRHYNPENMLLFKSRRRALSNAIILSHFIHLSEKLRPTQISTLTLTLKSELGKDSHKTWYRWEVLTETYPTISYFPVSRPNRRTMVNPISNPNPAQK